MKGAGGFGQAPYARYHSSKSAFSLESVTRNGYIVISVECMLSVDGRIHESGEIEVFLVGSLYYIDITIDFPARTTVLHLLDDFVSCIRWIGVAYSQDSLQVVLYYGAESSNR